MVTFALFVALFQLQPFNVQENEDRNREQVGEVLGKAVYRDELSHSSDTPLINQLQILFAAPVLEEYKKAHLEEITPAKSEISNAREYFDRKHEDRIKQGRPGLLKQIEVVEEKLAQSNLAEFERGKLESKLFVLQTKLKAPGLQFAKYYVGKWKLERHIYHKFGGGRIQWQQAGLETFDGWHEFFKSQEDVGKFKITDPKIRRSFYQPWTETDQGQFLSDDQIEDQFLHPEWLKKLVP